MDPNDQEWKEKLSRDPFARSGFDSRLRQKIERRIDEERVRKPKAWRNSWRLPAVSLASVAVLVLGFWLFNGQTGSGDRYSALESTAVESAGTLAAPSPAAPKKYALLLGLRTDKAGAIPVSEYRTVLIASEGDSGRQRLMAENNGLYLPSGQNFWQIATVPASGGRQLLQAVQVTNRKSSTVTKIEAPANLLSERVMFAGNRYLSIQSRVRDPNGKTTDNVWVKMLDMMNTKSADPVTEPHVRLEGILPDLVKRPPVEQWSVVRNPGQWMADIPDFTSLADSETAFPAPLPQEVVNRDKLTLSWDEIQKIEPAALDAFTYGDLLGVVAGGNVRVHVIRNGTPQPESVAVPLVSGESVIMIQWAEGKYVDRWIEVMRSAGNGGK